MLTSPTKAGSRSPAAGIAEGEAAGIDDGLILMGRIGEYAGLAFKVENESLDLPLSPGAELSAIQPIAGQDLVIARAGVADERADVVRAHRRSDSESRPDIECWHRA